MEFHNLQAKVNYLAENLQEEQMLLFVAIITGKTRDEVDDIWQGARREVLDELDDAAKELASAPRKEVTT